MEMKYKVKDCTKKVIHDILIRNPVLLEVGLFRADLDHSMPEYKPQHIEKIKVDKETSDISVSFRHACTRHLAGLSPTKSIFICSKITASCQEIFDIVGWMNGEICTMVLPLDHICQAFQINKRNSGTKKTHILLVDQYNIVWEIVDFQY